MYLITALTQYEADHGAEVASPTAKVEEGETRVEIQSLHHLRVDTRSRQVDVSMPPSQVLQRYIHPNIFKPIIPPSFHSQHTVIMLPLLAHLVSVISVFIQVIVSAVYSSESPLHQVRADVVSLLQVVNQIVVVLTGTYSSTHVDY